MGGTPTACFTFIIYVGENNSPRLLSRCDSCPSGSIMTITRCLYEKTMFTIHSLEDYKKEVDKCQLLCSNCHAEEHERMRKGDVTQ